MITVLKNNWTITKKDGSKKVVSIPHDYAIEGPFSKQNDAQYSVINKCTIYGRTGSLPIGDSAVYERVFNIKDDSKFIYLELDGLMANSKVYVNDELVGGRPYGYSYFEIDISKKVHEVENKLRIELSPNEGFSRWYPGAGILRPIKIVQKRASHVLYNGSQIITQVEGKHASLYCNFRICLSKKMQDITVISSLYDPYNVEIEKKTTHTQQSGIIQHFEVFDPKLWDVKTPMLYKIVTKIYENNECVDEYESSFGIRTIHFDSNEGMMLNGKNIKLHGVCLHHDSGMLGAGVNVTALKRQIRILKDMGVNAVRTSHNPTSVEFLDICDREGIMVLEEAFDEWKVSKVTNGYSNLFEEWHEKDLRAMIRRDRNHPSIIMWSIGNEIKDLRIPDGVELTKELVRIAKEEDLTRPITSGVNCPEPAMKYKITEELDIFGLNYHWDMYKQIHESHPDLIMYASETVSCVSTRGFYRLPVKFQDGMETYSDRKVSSYDLCGVHMPRTPDYEFRKLEEAPFVFGEFVWTGFDYLGEPSPYQIKGWSRSSYFGIVDLCGIPKDRYYNYQSKWTDKDVLHLLPHWNWHEGDKVEVQCYSSFDEVELFLNGRSLGVRRKSDDIYMCNRHIWKEVPFEKGYIKAIPVGRNDISCSVYTAAEPAYLKLLPETDNIANEEDGICYVLCEVRDKEGHLCPLADNKVEFSCDDTGRIVACDNGSQTDTRIFAQPFCTAFYGKCMVVVGIKNSGLKEIKLKAKSDGLIGDEAVIELV